jgi:hypothetical protein
MLRCELQNSRGSVRHRTDCSTVPDGARSSKADFIRSDGCQIFEPLVVCHANVEFSFLTKIRLMRSNGTVVACPNGLLSTLGDLTYISSSWLLFPLRR